FKNNRKLANAVERIEGCKANEGGGLREDNRAERHNNQRIMEIERAVFNCERSSLYLKGESQPL
ncbi:hypothetical protein, partial [Bacillus licheniformis]|uniref:hypothetical protein n=1 Tax=Bacillus licheniformis TaxID=1402 RepID=UPI003B586732